MAKHVLESVVEDHLVRRCADLGLLCLKAKAVSVRGMPDRLVLGHDSNGDHVALFIELKRPGSAPRASQRHRIAELREHGAHAVCADTKDSVDQLLEEYFITPSVPIAEKDPTRAPLPGASAAVVIPRL